MHSNKQTDNKILTPFYSIGFKNDIMFFLIPKISHKIAHLFGFNFFADLRLSSSRDKDIFKSKKENQSSHKSLKSYTITIPKNTATKKTNPSNK